MNIWTWLFLVTLAAFIGGLILDLGWLALGLWVLIFVITAPALGPEDVVEIESPERG